MKMMIKIVFAAALIAAENAAAQAQTKTVQIGSNCTVTVTTSVLTNGGGVVISGGGNTFDPQVIIQALGGQDGGVKMGGSALDPQSVMKIIGTLTGGGDTAFDPQALRRALTGAARGAGMGVVTGTAQLSTNPVTWLGLAADEVSAEERAQLPLPENAGLLVSSVTRDGPAMQAGVWANDILVKLDDQLLINAAQLRALVLGKKEGDKIALSLLRKGKEMQVTATLAKRVPPPDETIHSQVINLGSAHLNLSPTFSLQNQPGDTNAAGRINLRAILEAVSNAMQQAQQELNGPSR
ncbi:MAG: PDZ domain-containing protein [Kiritimatiellaeota bacterium]|nr:PDZ domain-containing protein [Kiritimatiellota bacterium]